MSIALMNEIGLYKTGSAFDFQLQNTNTEDRSI